MAELELDKDSRADLARIARALERIADLQHELVETSALGLRLGLLQAGHTLEELREAAAEADAPPPEGKPAVELEAAQSQDELERLEAAHLHAEARLGRGKVPASFDLYTYAEDEGITVPQPPTFDEPVGVVDPGLLGMDLGGDIGGEPV